MKKKWILFLILTISAFQYGMANRGQYDEEAREQERLEKAAGKAAKKSGVSPAKRFAGGIKEATLDSTVAVLSETSESTQEEGLLVGPLEGARRSSGKILDSTVKGAVKVATLGYGEVENYEIVEPEKNSGEPTKIKIKIPGT